MSTLSIQTAQNTQLQIREASLGERIIATLIDLAVMAVYASIITIVLKISGLKQTSLLYTPLMFYSLAFELIWGKSLGKKLLNLGIIHESGAPLSYVHTLLRWVIRIIDIWLFFGSIGSISIIVSKKGQRLGDLAAGTIVVKIGTPEKFTKNSYYNTEKDYVPIFEEVKILNDEDVLIAKEALAFLKDKGFSPPTVEVLNRSRNFIEKKMEVKSGLKNVPFLETVLKDYYTLH